jgi:hypothetical protein
MHSLRAGAQQTSYAGVFDHLITKVQVAHASRRQNNSRLFFGLKNPQAGEPKNHP